MNNYLNTTRYILVLFVLLSGSTALGDSPSEPEEYCDYYDDYSDMLISFPAKSELLPTGPSALSGIGMILPDGSELGIAPTLAGDDDVWQGRSVTRDSWYEARMEQGCRPAPMPPEQGRLIVCPHAIYSLLYKPAAYKGGPEIYIYVHHLFKGEAPSPYYKKVMDSMLLFYGEEANEAVSLFEDNRFAGMNPDDPFVQPRNFCGKNRVRDAIVAQKKKAP